MIGGSLYSFQIQVSDLQIPVYAHQSYSYGEEHSREGSDITPVDEARITFTSEGVVQNR